MVAFTGAGISAESGIPTFRDPGGIWDRFDPSEFGTWDGLLRLAMSRPEALADFLSELRGAFSAARPGPAHVALARLEQDGVLDGVITQNVDGLHQEAGGSEVVEIHGSFTRTVCLGCGHRSAVSRPGVPGGLDRAIVGLRTAFVASLSSLLPQCPLCGSPSPPTSWPSARDCRTSTRPSGWPRGAESCSWWGPPARSSRRRTSPRRRPGPGATVIEVATAATFVQADLRLEGPAGQVLPALVEAAGRRRGSVD